MGTWKRRFLASVLAATASLVLGTVNTAVAQPEGAIVDKTSNPVAGTFLVTYKPDTTARASSQQAAQSLTERFGGTVDAVLSKTMSGFVVTGLSGKQARRMAADPRVAEVRQSGTARIGTSSLGPGGTQKDPQNWGIDRIDQRDRPLDRSYTYPNDGAGVTAYIVDTGINYTHNEFGGRAKAGVDFINANDGGKDCNGHGSHVAGIVGGSTRGVAKKADLVSVRILKCDGYGQDTDVNKAAEWIAQNAKKPAVVNMSIYTDDPDVAVSAIRGSINSGVQWALINGNNGGNVCSYGPGGQMTEGVTTGSTTSGDGKRSDSNYGTCMDVWAPGDSINSAWINGNSSYNTIGGTSMAAPHVAGAMALRLHDAPSSTPAELEKWVVDNASQGKLSGIGSSPNKLLYIPNTGTPPDGPVARFTASCPSNGLKCSFDGSTSSGTISSYKWAFGDNTADGDGKTVDHTYGTKGTYTVKLTVTDNTGKSNTAEQQVNVGGSGGGQPPTASFTVNCQSSANCAFDGTGSRDPDGQIASHAWDFGDGTTGNGATTRHTYPAKSATYTAKLTVTDNSGNSATSQRSVQCWGFGSGQAFCF
ncbi:hypothetical protein ALI144C_22300 [Actinosynnema sp. ALI-1.44]|uniref:PKD domain-containing protein n=1 Tax=Actinosynnema sp. ALI-1.44 TaxID=1933779 RepID=UPI00097C9744|nr:PKD domain-containing protein [Actinosynnema sp. ALI-1.44]ONI81260.1 hypothetical protein ALI144C_22300 [Actinosynnema sp. ALI-1.44]